MFAVLLINPDAGCGSQYYDANHKRRVTGRFQGIKEGHVTRDMILSKLN